MTDTREAPPGSAPCPDDVVLGRYRLIDRIGDTAGTVVWHGQDERLARPVSLRFAPLESEVADKLRAAAVEASRVLDRRAVAILDIADDHDGGHLIVVTEWLRGTAFGDYLSARNGEPLPAREAATLAVEVARFLAAAEAVGVTHGRLRPNAVMVTDSGEVRVRGLGVDQALHGTELGLDPRLADIHGVGSVLYAGLTGRWPGPLDAEHLPGVPSVGGGRTPPPSRVVADVPSDLDEIAARAVQTTHAPKGLGHFVSVEDVEAALSASLVSTPAPVVGRRWSRPLVRAISVGVAVLAAIGLAGLGVDLVKGLGGTALVVPRAQPADPSTGAPKPGASTPAPTGDQVLPIVSVTDYDPYGNDRHENPQLAPMAIDNDPVSSWRTVSYRAADMSGKPGVGMLVDLGAPRPVDAVRLSLLGLGTDLTVYATDNPTKKMRTFTTMVTVAGAPSQVTLRVPRPVTTRYLVVWFTRLPSVDGRFQGGISDVKVLG